MNFINQAFNDKNNWWRYAILLSVFLSPFLSKFIYRSFLRPFFSYFPDDVTVKLAIREFRYVILLTLFFGMFKLLHKRNVKTLITGRKKFDFLRFWLSFSVWGVVLILVFSVKVILYPELYKFNFNLFPFLKLSILITFMSIFKVVFTVALMNSYVLQMFTVMFKKTWLALLISVLLFTSLMYLQNSNLGLSSIFYYLVLGVFLYLIIILDDGTELALGVLLVSILVSRLFITYSTYKTQLDAVFTKEGSRDTFLLGVVIPFCFIIFFFFLYRTYDWKEKLTKVIE